MLEIVTLMENQMSKNRSLKNSHGLSFYLTYNGKHYLFDCGPNDMFLYNAKHLGIDVNDVEGVILSHNHYDHGSGYIDYLNQSKNVQKLYVGRSFYEHKYAAVDGIKYCDLSSGVNLDLIIQSHVKVDFVDDVLEVNDGMYLVSNFKKYTDYEVVPKRFVKYVNGEMVQDEFKDEISVVFKTNKGLVVIVGCSHYGIVNILKTIHEYFKEPIYAVFGGTHLVEASVETIHKVIKECKQMGIEIMGLSHCSGEKAECILQEYDGIKACHLAVGDTLFID